MAQKISLNRIYTHVNILRKITGRNRRELAELLPKKFHLKFERFSLSDVKRACSWITEAVRETQQADDLGKPQIAGKTTFLKHLAVQCIGGKFQANRSLFSSHF
jgi:predicted NACHT family NTPase